MTKQGVNFAVENGRELHAETRQNARDSIARVYPHYVKHIVRINDELAFAALLPYFC